MKINFLSSLLTGVFLSLLIFALPTTVEAEPVETTAIVCDPWVYSYSYYTCINGNTYLVDVYKRKCGDNIEFWKDMQLYVPGFCMESSEPVTE